MVEERDFVLVSIPFVVGVALMQALSPCVPLVYAIASISQILAVLLLCFIVSRKNVYLQAILLFFILGIFSWSTSALCPQPPVHHASAWLSGLVDRCGFSEPLGGLLKALLTGDRSSLSREVAVQFRQAGASHILALSGLHLGVIYALINKLLLFLGNGRWIMIAKSIFCVAVCAVYVHATGMSDSIIRAFIFICINETWKHFPGRRRRPAALFCLSLTIHLLLKPQAVAQIGFQLSYMAMLGIMTVYPVLRSWSVWDGKFSLPGKIWDSAALALSCQLFTAPLVYRTFHTFPQTFLITNIVLMPVSEALIICGAVSCLGTALGICPDIIKNLTEVLGQAVLFCVRVISSIT